MIELISIAFSPLNIVFTILLLVIVIYWITVIIGVADVDMFNIGFDADLDMDAIGDADIDGMPNSVQSALDFFYIGEIPVMVLISLLILSMWALSILSNYYFNPDNHIWRALGFLCINFIISLFIVKLIGAPMRPLYALFNQDYNAPKKTMGSTCQITSTSVTNSHMGQAEIKTKGAPIVLNVLSRQNHSFTKDDKAVIVKKNTETGIYYIVPPNLEK